MLKFEDLPTDADTIASDTEVIVCEDNQDLANVGVILGQLDPTEVDHRTGQPRWTPDQMEIIVKLNSQLREWQE